MDRRVKERLVGASILVVLIVLIVPELLSGPPAPPPASAHTGLPISTPEPVRNVTVDLATSKAQSPEPAASAAATSSPIMPAEAHGGEAASAAGEPAAVLPAAAPARTKSSAPIEHTPLETTARPPKSGTTAVKPVIAGHGWAVQLGTFASRANADKLARQLKAQGFAVHVLSSGSGSSQRYRVRIGPMADRGAAAQTVAKLKSSGHIASLVPPGP
jgi:DedD protein